MSLAGRLNDGGLTGRLTNETGRNVHASGSGRLLVTDTSEWVCVKYTKKDQWQLLERLRPFLSVGSHVLRRRSADVSSAKV